MESGNHVVNAWTCFSKGGLLGLLVEKQFIQTEHPSHTLLTVVCTPTHLTAFNSEAIQF